MRDLNTESLKDISSLTSLSLSDWDLLVRQALASDSLARVAALGAEAGLLEAAPPAPGAHLRAAQIHAKAQEREVLREIEYVRKALARTGVRPIILKGAAYLLAKLPAAKGRFISDLDILVAKDALGPVESALMLHGWATGHHNAYDQHYYRKWMHELPPFQHVRRETVLDVHHNILPETARLKPRADLLLSAAIPVPAAPGLLVLCPPDMILHSMTHLFHNEELSHGLRDLSDIDLLLRHFGREDEFWDSLIERAEQLDLKRPLHYGLRYASRLLDCPVPARVLAATAPWGPPLPLASLMDALWSRALRPYHSTVADRFTVAALFMLYVRGHWLRMPPHLLAVHLTIKAFRRTPVESK